jgi:hypothetical protein
MVPIMAMPDDGFIPAINEKWKRMDEGGIRPRNIQVLRPSMNYERIDMNLPTHWI